ncbi:sulfurtransferase complex subunit TusC [Pseudoalteromonas piscicida]|uniref:Sulfurtransferase complex subunit TusC n=1 Tax=Pseudoalteromonas piscicida TaxID=43662 RepID=A0A2A5JS40_PSEO7|nr:sulfurtransferase complex subunit TusC [Pseudoalteromonas piscicida]PCK32284.1 sulfurtransferase complex subunit TusC [Pseudoalteromonas piscicida]
MSRKILVISNKSPFDGTTVKEALDVALIYAAIDQQVSWLFTGPAVLALKKDLNAQTLGIKDVFKQIKTLEIYDVDQVYACQSAITAFNLCSNSLAIDVEVKDQQAISLLIEQHDFVVTL